MEYVRRPLPHDVRPGAEVEVLADVPLPAEHGNYTLRFDPVDDNVMWFSQAGSAPLDVPLEVVDPQNDPAYRATLALMSEPASTRLPAGSRGQVALRVANAGVVLWPRAETPGPGAIRLGAQLMDVSGTPIQQDFARVELPRGLAPGESCEVPLSFKLPSTPGRYRLKVDLLQEQVCWFEERGSRPLELEVEATSDPADSLSPGVLRARIDLIRPDSGTVRAGPGDAIAIHVRATNQGNTLWRSAEDGRRGHVRLGARLLASDGARDYWRAPLSHDVAPGETTEIQSSMRAPIDTGDCTVVLDLVDEGIAWFEQEGSATARFRLRVAWPDQRGSGFGSNGT
jgi:hypothetical protein